MKEKIKIIAQQLKAHAPFTLFGAFSGMLIVFFVGSMSHDNAERVFYVFHPLHVVLSALATSAMYKKFKHQNKSSLRDLLILLLIGLFGSIGVATLSDSLIPYVGEVLLAMPHAHVHAGFIEVWWIVIPAALLGIGIAYFKPNTKFSHAGHVFISTWASLFHMMMAMDGGGAKWHLYPAIFLFLFLAVWLPCCLSDIIFPLVFLGKVEPCKH